jgi:signal peptidase I
VRFDLAPAVFSRACIAALSVVTLAPVACAQQGEGSSRRDSAVVVRNVSPAMERTLRAGANVTVQLFRDSVDAARSVQRGDLVMYAWPPDTARRFIKRVAGLPGDTLGMVRGTVVLNGAPVREPYAWHADSAPAPTVPEMVWMRKHALRGAITEATRNDWGPIVVPRSAWFLLGDNRDNSLDSRYWGFVSAGQLLGKVSSAPTR